MKFNKDCLKYNLKPNYINVEIQNQSSAAKRTKLTAEKIWIKNEIKFLYAKKNIPNTLIYRKYLTLANTSHPSILHNVITKIDYQTSMITRKKRNTLKKKFNKLINSQNSIENAILFDFEFFPRTLNKTKIVFDSDEIDILNKGLNYNTRKTGRKGNFDELINAECAIKAIPEADHREAARYLFSEKTKFDNNKAYIPSLQYKEQRTLKKVKEKLVENNAILCKCDKGNSTVILYEDDYISKVNEFIQNNDITEVNKDPTNLFQRKIKNLINKC